MASKSMAALSIAFGANTKGFDRAMKKAQAKMKKFGAGLKKTGKTLSMGLTAPLLAFAGASVRAFDIQAKAEAALLTALKGRVDVQQRLITQAQELQKVTLFGDEETIAGQTMLATMGLEEDAIIRLMPLIQDMAVAKRMNLVQAADLVAKSVGSSTNALSRYGITITGAVGSQERLETAALALGKAFEGQAEAAALVGAGSLVQLKNQLGDISEEIGGMLMPSIVKVVEKIKGMAEGFSDLSLKQKENMLMYAAIAAAIGPVLIILGQLTIVLAAALPLFVKLGVAMKAVIALFAANPFLIAVVGIAAFTAALMNANEETKRLRDNQIGLRKALKDADEEVAERLVKIRNLVEETKKQIKKDEDYSKNLNTLQAVSEKYFGHLEHGKLTLNQLETATKSYTNSIIILAKVKAAEEEMIELSKQQLKLEREALPIREKRNKQMLDIMNNTSGLTRIRKTMEMVVGTGIVPLGDADASKLATYNKEIKHTKDNIKTLADFIKKTKETSLDLFTTEETKEGAEGGGGGELTADQKKALEKANKERAKILQEQADFEIDEYNNMIQTKAELEQKYYDSLLTEQQRELNAVEDKYFALIEMAKKYGFDTVELEKARQKEIDDIKGKEEEANEKLDKNLEESLRSGAENMKEYVKNVKAAVREIIVAKVAEAVAGALASAFSSLPFPLNLISAPMAMGVAKTLANQFIPSFAEGGLVSKPTLAMVGDSPHGAEMIMPINKLKAMMGSQTQNVTVTGRISGTDIFLSNQRTSNNRKRGI